MKDTIKQIDRKSNLELLRIVSMLMIIGLHYFNSSKGGALGALHFPQYNFFITYYLESIFIIAVNCFVLLTGYFQIEKETIKYKKVVRLFAITSFYSVLFYSIHILIGGSSFSTLEFAKSFLPLFYGQYWFVKVYLILYIFSPFLNMALNKMNQAAYAKFILLLILIFSVWPSILPASSPSTDCGYGIVSFTMVYSVGGFIKKHYIANRSKYFYLLGYLAFGTATFVFQLALPKLNLAPNAWNYNFIFNIFSAIFLFLFFSKIKLQSNTINYIASFMLSIYIIHENIYVSPYLFTNILHTSNYWFSPLFVLHLIGSIFFIFSLTLVIDIIRNWLFILIKQTTNTFAQNQINVNHP